MLDGWVDWVNWSLIYILVIGKEGGIERERKCVYCLGDGNV